MSAQALKGLESSTLSSAAAATAGTWCKLLEMTQLHTVRRHEGIICLAGSEWEIGALLPMSAILLTSRLHLCFERCREVSSARNATRVPQLGEAMVCRKCCPG